MPGGLSRNTLQTCTGERSHARLRLLWSLAEGVGDRVCRQDWCLGAVLDVTLGFLGSVTDGEPVDHVICRSLAHQFHALAAAYVACNLLEHTATVTVWPPTV